MKKYLILQTVFLFLTSQTPTFAQVTANFSWTVDTIYCDNMQVSFSDLSTGPATNWFWNFGNAASSTLQNPTVIYTTGGIYSVTLIVVDAGGNKDTLLQDSIINAPFASGSFTFTPTSGSNPLTVCFTANTQNTISYTWDFGDGTVLNSIGDTCHTYTNAGTFIPILLLHNTLPNSTPCISMSPNLTGQVTVNPAGVNDYGKNILVAISPNPFSTQTTLQTAERLQNASLTVCNIVGQTVKRIDNLFGQTVLFQRDNLPSGLYFIRLTQDGNTISADKFVITDK